MMTVHRSRTWALAVLASLVAGVLLLATAPDGVRAEEEARDTGAEEPAQPEALEPRYEPPAEQASPSETEVSVLYVPPEIGFPGRRIGAGTRGMGRKASLQILAPDHLGYTTEEQPTLYWYLAEPTTLRIEFTIRDETSVEPLLEVELKKPARAGVQAVRLADHGVRLLPGTNYQWFVSLVPDPERRSKDFLVGAWIARGEPPQGCCPNALASAQAGLWYDAVGTLSAGIDAAPRDATLRAQRAALLEQVGLSEVAAYDLAAAGN